MKTNFLNKLKHGLFLLIAVLGTFISYAQPTQTTTIGGSKTPDVGALLDIGGKQRPEPLPVTNLSIGTQCIFAFMEDIGGGKSVTVADSCSGQVNYPEDTDLYNIGGRGSSGTGTGMIVYFFDSESNYLFSHTSDIGGGGRGTSTDTGQFDDDDYDLYDIGGKNTPGDIGLLAVASSVYKPGHGCLFDIGGRDSGGGLLDVDTGGGKSSDGGFLVLADIGGRGGRGTSSDTGQFDDDDYDLYDIGGKNTPGDIGLLAVASSVYKPGHGCLFDIGGRDSGGGLLDVDTGGGKSSDGGFLVLADIGGRGGRGTSTGGDYNDHDDNSDSSSSFTKTDEVPESYLWLSVMN